MLELVVVVLVTVSLPGLLLVLDAPPGTGALVSAAPGAGSLAAGLPESDWFSVELFPQPAINSRAINGMIFFIFVEFFRQVKKSSAGLRSSLPFVRETAGPARLGASQSTTAATRVNGISLVPFRSISMFLFLIKPAGWFLRCQPCVFNCSI
jgi:hypothetical protein